MANGSDPNIPVPTPAPNPTALDNQVLNNGVKLLGESLVPGASLLLEKHITAGVMLGALGVLGGAAFGKVFGPLGYILARYGASAISFSQSVQDPPPPPTNGGVGSAPVVNEVREMRRDFATVASALSRIAPAPPPTQPAAFTAAAQSDLAEQIASAMRSVVPEMAAATGDAVGRSVRAAMKEATPSARTRRTAASARA